MDESRSVKFLGLLRALLRHGVDFLVVGGVTAQLEGAPILTFDLDVLYDKTPENLDRLLAVLEELKAHYRDPAGRHIVPDMDKLETFRMHLLLTDLGALDVLSAIGNGLTYRASGRLHPPRHQGPTGRSTAGTPRACPRRRKGFMGQNPIYIGG